MTLEERFTEFVRSLRNSEIVDELQFGSEHKQSKKPDFFFFERQFIGEMKSIKKDMGFKVQAILDKHKDRPEYPLFFGEWEISKILKHLPDGEQINQKIFDAITSGLEDSVEKANRQIREAKNIFTLGDSEGILIILNDLVEVLSPNIIAHKVCKLLGKKYPSGETRYPHISVVWIISEIHVLKTEVGLELLPSIVCLNDYASSYQEANNYVNWLQKKWASFNNLPFVEGCFDMASSQFSKREEPNFSGMIQRNEMWKKQYAKTPYLRNLSQEQLLNYGQRIWSEIFPAFIIGTHEKPSQEKVYKLMEQVTHFIEEINHQGIDFREFSPKLREAFEMLQQVGKIKIQDEQYPDED